MQLPRAESILAESLRALLPLDAWRYPEQAALLDALSCRWQVPPESMALTAGSSAAIGAIVDALAVPAGRLILQEPSFDLWRYFATIRGVPAQRCRGINGHVPAATTEEFESALNSGPPAVAAITNPGNPLGDLIPLDAMRRLARKAQTRDHVLVIDDCYGVFANARHLDLLAEHPRLLVVRSLSKSWALAGARLSVVFGSPVIIDYLQRFRLDTAVSALTIGLASQLAARMDDLSDLWREVRDIRDWFAAQVKAGHPDWLVLPSQANFLTIRTSWRGGGDDVTAHLAAGGIRVRSLEDIDGFAGCFRVSIAAREVMGEVLKALATA